MKYLKIKKMYYVYILTNIRNNVLYVGVTNDLERRVYEHKNKLVEGFTKKYNVNKLVYFEQTSDVNSAIAREKQLKGLLKIKKEKLINEFNPNWKDLSEEF
jgi:putative endonuclease